MPTLDPTHDKLRPNRKIHSVPAFNLYCRGACDPEIARAFDVTVRAVRSWRRFRRLAPNRDQGGRAGVRVLSPADKVEAIALLRAGASLASIARRYRVSDAVIAWHRDSAGLRHIWREATRITNSNSPDVVYDVRSRDSHLL